MIRFRFFCSVTAFALTLNFTMILLTSQLWRSLVQMHGDSHNTKAHLHTRAGILTTLKLFLHTCTGSLTTLKLFAHTCTGSLTTLKLTCTDARGVSQR